MYRKSKLTEECVDVPCCESVLSEKSGSKYRHFALLGVLIIHLLGTSAAYGKDTISVPNFVAQPSLSTEPVDLHIGSSHWQIPRNYLFVARVGKDTGRAFFYLLATIPDFSGATKESIRCFTSSRPRNLNCENVVAVYRGYVSARRYQEKLFEALATHETEQVYGLEKFVGRVTGLGTADHYIFRGSSAKDTVAYSCRTRGSGNLTGYCRASVDLTDDLTITYEFEPERLPDWRLIHRGITNLFDNVWAGRRP